MKSGVDAAEAFLAGRIDQQRENEVREVVAGGALDRPVLAQQFMRCQDLLDHEIEVVPRLLAQPLQITLGIEQPVDMVDAQTVEDAAFQKPEHQTVRVVEHLRQLHPEAGEVVDVEEAAIVDVVGGDAEMRGAPILLLDQRVEVAPAVARH